LLSNGDNIEPNFMSREFVLSNGDLRLTDFPYSKPGYGRKVAVVGVGSAGCRIASQLSKESRLLEHFIYVTCDEQDVANIVRGERLIVEALSRSNRTPYLVRDLASSKFSEIRQALSDSDVVFIVAGLGGAVGSGLAPLIAKSCSDHAVSVAILVMPYNFEKAKHFFAGCALNQMRRACSGVVIIDNDELLKEDVPIIDAYANVNQKIALALNKLLGSAQEHEFGVGLNNVINFVRTSSYSVLCLGESSRGQGYRSAVINAAKHFERTVDTRQASKSMVHICADQSITMNGVVGSIGGLSGILGSGTMQVEFGISANSSGCATAIIMATGFSTTKFESYDPVDSALKSKDYNMESGFDTALDLEVLLPDLEVD
jgi:cell division protein FtsZ